MINWNILLDDLLTRNSSEWSKESFSGLGFPRSHIIEWWLTLKLQKHIRMGFVSASTMAKDTGFRVNYTQFQDQVFEFLVRFRFLSRPWVCSKFLSCRRSGCLFCKINNNSIDFLLPTDRSEMKRSIIISFFFTIYLYWCCQLLIEIRFNDLLTQWLTLEQRWVSDD